MSRRAPWVVLAIALAATAWLARLGEPSWGQGTPRYLFDEHYTAFAAHRLLQGDPAIFAPAARRYEYVAFGTSDLASSSRGEWSHPPGAANVVAMSMALFGFNAVAARLPSVLAALCVLFATASLAGRKHAAWACAFLACDGVFFVFARTAMPHVMLVAGVTAGAAFILRSRRASTSRGAALGAGVAFGFAASVRWTAVPIALAILAAAAWTGARRGRLRGPGVTVVAGFVTYLAAFTPFFLHGGTLSGLVHLHREMLWFHEHMPAHLAFSSPWYEWPWSRRPIPFGTRTEGARHALVWAVRNPVVWWSTVPVVALAAWRARHRFAVDAVGACAVLGVWLPWVVVGRFALYYYLMPAMPFVAVLAARALDGVRLRHARRFVLGAAFSLFVLMYPVIAAVPLDRGSPWEQMWLR